MLRQVLAIVTITLTFACGNNNDSTERKDGFSHVAGTPEDSLFQEVMHGHDTAMAKIGKLKSYRKQVAQKMDSVGKLKGSAKVTAGKPFSILDEQLKNAEEGMDLWMTQFKIDSAEGDTEKRIEYLSSEKAKIDKVRADIFSALNSADSLLNRK